MNLQEKFIEIVREVIRTTVLKTPRIPAVGDILVNNYMSTRAYRVLEVDSAVHTSTIWFDGIGNPGVPIIHLRLQRIGYVNKEGEFIHSPAKPFTLAHTAYDYYRTATTRFLNKHSL